MQYKEIPPPLPLRHAIKLGWTLEMEGRSSDRIEHVATPDGCVELIRRTRGRSFWRGEQPDCFVAGVIRSPASLQLSGDSKFVGVRLWPWAWNALGGTPAPELLDRWADVRGAGARFALAGTIEPAMNIVAQALSNVVSDPLYDAILQSHSVADLARRSGRSHRWIQRWFERNIGISPRTYLRLLRFSNAFGDLPPADGSLAGHAAEHGFADQAHMSREFRSMAGSSVRTARKTAVGPFL